MPRRLILHVPRALQRSIDQGQHNFFSILLETFAAAGLEVKTTVQRRRAGQLARLNNEYHLFHIDGAVGKRALNVRQAQFYPFWSLENAGERYTGRISKLEFDAASISGIAAQDFFNKICVRNLPGNPQALADSDFAFIPLQGHIQKQRSWQYGDTAAMVNSVLAHDPERQIILKLQDNGIYSASDRKFLQDLANQDRVSISEADRFSLLKQCRYVVSQNSDDVFVGFLYQKPAVLFAHADFHHICQTVTQPAMAQSAFDALAARPAFEKYVYWYLQLNCINAGRDDAAAVILEMARECGWDLPSATTAK